MEINNKWPIALIINSLLILPLQGELLPRAQDFACGQLKYEFRSARIVGGTASKFGEWPWQIYLYQSTKKTSEFQCGAALINENWAVTTGYCVDGIRQEDFVLRLGEFDLGNQDEAIPHVERRVKKVVIHPKYDKEVSVYDLALIRFSEPIEYQDNILPVCLPTEAVAKSDLVGRMATATGWGSLFYPRKEEGGYPSKLQKVSVPIISNQDCEKMLRPSGYDHPIPNIFLCAGYPEGKKDSCTGDSGSPLVIPEDGIWTLVGLTSWGLGCAEPNKPGVYTRINAEALEWINKEMKA